jgi:hypothetical protein
MLIASAKKPAQEIVRKEGIEARVTGTSLCDHQSSFAALVVRGCPGRSNLWLVPNAATGCAGDTTGDTTEPFSAEALDCRCSWPGQARSSPTMLGLVRRLGPSEVRELGASRLIVTEASSYIKTTDLTERRDI